MMVTVTQYRVIERADAEKLLLCTSGLGRVIVIVDVNSTWSGVITIDCVLQRSMVPLLCSVARKTGSACIWCANCYWPLILSLSLDWFRV